ncbi:MAG: adenylate/guanylate cyclase domain-containing protein [Candidatus Cloacimonadaceae bacterium]|nr:adenylate/guanylate cyclase domain-containing protein [Candidatus Cloacimonadaceae bacterium]
MNILSAIKDPNSELAMLLDSLYDGVYVVDRQRRILFWNRAAAEMTGYSSEEVLGRCCSDDILNHIDENGVLLCHSFCPLMRAMESGGTASAKVYPLTKQGRRFPVQTHVSSILDDNGKAIAGIEVFRDISYQEEYRIMQEKFNSIIRKYVSNTTYNDVMERLIQDATSGKPRIVDLSVLYLDIVNFTGFSEQNTPEESVKLLNEFFSVCEVITKECLGDIDKFIGDAIMAVFHDANDAVRSAIRILSYGLPELNRVRKHLGKSEVRIRVGINSGLALQGDIGTIDRKDLTVIGDTVNTASRIERCAPPNHLMISEATLSRLIPDLHALFAFHHSEELRGKKEAIKLYLLSEQIGWD